MKIIIHLLYATFSNSMFQFLGEDIQKCNESSMIQYKLILIGARMSIETLTPLNNDIRYQIKLKYHKKQSYVVYEMTLIDLAMGKREILLFRYSEIKKFHQDLIKKNKLEKQRLPQFPKANSLKFWNRTNKSSKLIQDRKRQLEYYFTKLLNDPHLRSLAQVKTLLTQVIKERRRTKSFTYNQTSTRVDTQTETCKSHSLPKFSLPQSVKEELFNLS